MILYAIAGIITGTVWGFINREDARYDFPTFFTVVLTATIAWPLYGLIAFFFYVRDYYDR